MFLPKLELLLSNSWYFTIDHTNADAAIVLFERIFLFVTISGWICLPFKIFVAFLLLTPLVAAVVERIDVEQEDLLSALVFVPPGTESFVWCVTDCCRWSFDLLTEVDCFRPFWRASLQFGEEAKLITWMSSNIAEGMVWRDLGSRLSFLEIKVLL